MDFLTERSLHGRWNQHELKVPRFIIPLSHTGEMNGDSPISVFMDQSNDLSPGLCIKKPGDMPRRTLVGDQC